MGDINSLLRFRKLPVFLLGNSARKSLISQKVGKRSFVPRLRYPVFFPVTRESHFRDGFAHDCLLQQRVSCELTFGASTASAIGRPAACPGGANAARIGSGRAPRPEARPGYP